jgi:hypothetical protein
VADHAVQTPGNTKFQVLQHAKSSANLAPSDFHIFGPPKEPLRSQKVSGDEVKQAV